MLFPDKNTFFGNWWWILFWFTLGIMLFQTDAWKNIVHLEDGTTQHALFQFFGVSWSDISGLWTSVYLGMLNEDKDRRKVYIFFLAVTLLTERSWFSRWCTWLVFSLVPFDSVSASAMRVHFSLLVAFLEHSVMLVSVTVLIRSAYRVDDRPRDILHHLTLHQNLLPGEYVQRIKEIAIVRPMELILWF